MVMMEVSSSNGGVVFRKVDLTVEGAEVEEVRLTNPIISIRQQILQQAL